FLYFILEQLQRPIELLLGYISFGQSGSHARVRTTHGNSGKDCLGLSVPLRENREQPLLQAQVFGLWEIVRELVEFETSFIVMVELHQRNYFQVPSAHISRRFAKHIFEEDQRLGGFCLK